MAANIEDPFLQVQSELLTTLESTRPLFSSYLRIRSTASSAASPELVQARAELEANLRDINADLQDLVDSVRAAQQDPYRYGLEIEEVGRRAQLVKEVGDEVEGMQQELSNAVAARAGNAAGLPDPEAFEADAEDDYAAYEQQRQQEIMHEQDEQLDDVFKTVGNLRQQADTMGQELEEQGEILGEVDTLADRVGGKLQGGMKRINTIIKKNEDKYSSCCIAVLIFVLILLLILVIAL